MVFLFTVAMKIIPPLSGTMQYGSQCFSCLKILLLVLHYLDIISVWCQQGCVCPMWPHVFRINCFGVALEQGNKLKLRLPPFNIVSFIHDLVSMDFILHLLYHKANLCQHFGDAWNCNFLSKFLNEFCNYAVTESYSVKLLFKHCIINFSKC